MAFLSERTGPFGVQTPCQASSCLVSQLLCMPGKAFALSPPGPCLLCTVMFAKQVLPPTQGHNLRACKDNMGPCVVLQARKAGVNCKGLSLCSKCLCPKSCLHLHQVLSIRSAHTQSRREGC